MFDKRLKRMGYKGEVSFPSGHLDQGIKEERIVLVIQSDNILSKAGTVP